MHFQVSVASKKYFSFHVVPIYPESDHLKWPLDNFPTIDQNIRRENGNKEKVIKLKFKNEYFKKKKNPTLSFYSH